jgi:hypothetical protein
VLFGTSPSRYWVLYLALIAENSGTVLSSPALRAASHDQQLPWPARDAGDGLGVEDARVAEGHAGGAQRARPGCDDDALGVRPPLRAAGAGHHRVLGFQPPLAGHQVHAALADPLQRYLPELLADLAGPGPDGRVHCLRRRGQGDPVDLLLPERAEVGGGLPEGLGWRAAAGDHGADDGVALHQRDRVTQNPPSPAAHSPAGPAPVTTTS